MIDLIATIDKQREVIDRLRTENARLLAENESATKYLRTFSEELVIAGFAGGDRDVTLANLRTIIRERATLRELVRDVYKRGMVSPEWDERAEKAITPQT
jgi:hypothetical protein